MNNSKIFNDVVTYLESIAASGEEIDYAEISKIAMSPAALFQRIFIFVSEISIYDYVRKRRLTLAGRELKNGCAPVTETAIKYGFQSHSAFTRAFKEHHGITPSQAKLKTSMLNDYLPINFSEMRFIGGRRVMAEMKKIIYRETEERLMVGMRRETSFAKGAGIWREFFESGADKKLGEIPDAARSCDDIDDADGIGLMYDFKDRDNFSLIIGDFVKPGTEIPEGLYAKHIPGGLTAQVQIEGNNLGDILNSAYMLIAEAIEKTGKEIDFSRFYWCEVYTVERYSTPLKNGNKVIMDYIMPVK